MAAALKRQFSVMWFDWIWNLAVVLGASVLGFILYHVVTVISGDDATTYFPLGTVLGCVIAVIYAVIMIGVQVESYFNMEVSMGNTRRQFFVSYYIVCFAENVVIAALLGIFHMTENALNAWIWPQLELEVRLLPHIIKWGIPAAALVTVAAGFLGIFVMHFGRRAFWALWCLWMIICIAGPRIPDAMRNEPNSPFGRLGAAIGAIITNVPPYVWGIIIIGTGAAGLAAAWLIIRKQQVTL